MHAGSGCAADCAAGPASPAAQSVPSHPELVRVRELGSLAAHFIAIVSMVVSGGLVASVACGDGPRDLRGCLVKHRARLAGIADDLLDCRVEHVIFDRRE